jgi:hypothetical protein
VVPKYRLEPTVFVPMPDGVRLSTDFYFPAGHEGGPLPLILVRTMYNKNTWRDPQRFAPGFFTSHGYVFAVQDARGTHESEGVYLVSANEAADGDAAITWLANQPWCTGKVGTYGCSYLGEGQVLVATRRNPHHACMIPQAPGGVTRSNPFGFLTGGTNELATDLEWFRGSATTLHPQYPVGISREDLLRAASSFSTDARPPEIDFKAVLRTLPLVSMMERAGGAPSEFELFVSTPIEDQLWDEKGFIAGHERFNTPALWIDSWHDKCVAQTLWLFNLLQANSETEPAGRNQFAVVSPTGHCRSETTTERTLVGQRVMGDARFDHWGLYLRWFDYWLKDIDNGVLDMPKLQYYAMGANEWRVADQWPLPETRFTPWYLRSGGWANSRFGDGVLSQDLPGDEPPDHYVYDPATPVPTTGGPDPVSPWTGESVDQALVEVRHDVLVYTSPPLDQPLNVTGPIETVLYVSSSATDTDFVVRLVDVYPDGTAFNVQEGILRACYREGFDRQVRLTPGEVTELRVALGVTSNVFQPGHKIRVQVTSSNFPQHDRNLNTGGNNYDETEWLVAENVLHHSAERPSRLMLPVIPS